MKQTSNAIKFLIAQYKAIFKQAYFKGLASATLITLALASASAQAAKGKTYTGTETISGTTVTIDPTTDPAVKDDKYNLIKVKATNSANHDKAIVIIGGTIENNYISGSAATTFKAKSLTINTGNIADGLAIDGSTAATTADFTDFVKVQKGTINVVGNDADTLGTLNSKVIDIGTASQTTAKAAQEANAILNLDNFSYVGAELSDSNLDDLGVLNLNNDGKIVGLSGSSATSSSISVGTFNINGGTLSIEAKSDGSAGHTMSINTVKGAMNEGLISVQSGAKLEINLADANITDNGKTIEKSFSLSKGEIEAKGDISLKGEGRFVLGEPDVLKVTSESGKEAAFNVSGSDDQNIATLALSKKALDNLASKTQITTSYAILDITGSEQVVLGENKNLSFADTSASVDAILADSGTTIKAENMRIEGEVEHASEVAIQAENLTLAGGKASSLNSLEAKNVTFEAAADGTPYTLQQDLYLKSVKKIADPYGVLSGEFEVADKGILSGPVKINTGAGSFLNINAGDYTSNGDITLANGSFIVGGAGSNVSAGAKFTLNSSDTLTLTNDSSCIVKVERNGKNQFAPSWGEGKNSMASILDLSQGKLTINRHANNFTDFQVAGHGILALSEKQLADILNLGNNQTANGAGIWLRGITGTGSLLVIDGDFSGTQGIDVTKISYDESANSGETDTIVMAGKAGIYANNAWLTSSGDNLNLGAKDRIKVEGELKLDAVDAQSAATNFTVESGTLQVGSKLTSTNKSKSIVLGNSTSSANLELGAYSIETDAYSYPTQAGLAGKLSYTTHATGQVDVNLQLNGVDETDTSNLNVVYGQWQVQDITASNATITVDSNNANAVSKGVDTLKLEESVRPALIGKKLSLGAASSLQVAKGASATFDALAMSDATSDVDVAGTLTINGLAKVDGGNQDNGYGISAGSITVKGNQASLTLGSKALADLNFAAGATLDASNKYLNNIDLQEYGVVNYSRQILRLWRELHGVANVSL